MDKEPYARWRVANHPLDRPPSKQALRFSMSNFDINAFLRGMQLTLVGAHRALQNPGMFTSDHYKQAAYAVAIGIVIRLVITVPILALKFFIWVLSLFVSLDSSTWDESLTGGLDFIAEHVLQVPFFLMVLMRYMVPTLDNLFMQSLRWVDSTYTQKHKHDNQDQLRGLYYPNLSQYGAKHGSRTNQGNTWSTAYAFVGRFGRKAIMSVGVFALSNLPVVGKLILPAASFYTFKRAVGSRPAVVIFSVGMILPRNYLVIFLQTRIHFTKDEKRNWFRNREGVLFGFGLGFYILTRVPLFGVLIYGIAEASTAYLLTKITDPPPPPSEARQYAQSQQVWKNKHELLSLPLAMLDEGARQPCYDMKHKDRTEAAATYTLS